jgi:hypothetical protein
MKIDPTVALWLNVLYLTLSGVTAAALAQTGIANPEQVAAIAALFSVPLNIFLHLTSSYAPGPFAAPGAGTPQQRPQAPIRAQRPEATQ